VGGLPPERRVQRGWSPFVFLFLVLVDVSSGGEKVSGGREERRESGVKGPSECPSSPRQKQMEESEERRVRFLFYY